MISNDPLWGAFLAVTFVLIFPIMRSSDGMPTPPRPSYVDGAVPSVESDGSESHIVVAANQKSAEQETRQDRPTEELPEPTPVTTDGGRPTPADSRAKPRTTEKPKDDQAELRKDALTAPIELTPSRLLPTPLQESKPAPQPYLGARVMKNGIGSVTVVRVRDDSPAARAKLRVGDAITAIDGRPVGSFHELMLGVRQKKEGEVVKLTLLRGTGETKLDVKLAVPTIE